MDLLLAQIPNDAAPDNNHLFQPFVEEGHAFQYFSFSPTTTTMRNFFAIFVLVIVFAITCGAEAFRGLVGRIRHRRALRKSKFTSSQPIVTDENEPLDDDSSSDFSPSSSLREASRVMLQELWDFSPFNFSSDDSLTEEEYEPDLEADVVHFCFLVHGHRGFSRDLSYLQAVMRKSAAETREQLKNQTLSDNTQQRRPRQDLVVHSTVCNEKKTDDGVEAGGDRLTEELRSVILQEMAQRERLVNSEREELPLITLSFLGNSLGGIYSRYAIAKLFESCERDQKGHLILDGRYRLRLNVFCTTATPHLGVASHTFFRIPRTAELGIAKAMGQTGQDIFRVNDLMRRMATLSQFIAPMKLFRHRIAYANAYGTDFPVPCQTAAFLHDSSDYPHHFVDNKLKRTIVEEHSDLCIATVHTPPQHHHHSDQHFDVADETDELVVMSRSLDALGWKKVFVDPRKIVPKLSNPIPRALGRAATLRLNMVGSSINSANASDGDSSMETSDSEHDEEPADSYSQEEEAAIERLQARGVAPSREVFHALSTSPQTTDQFHWPFGHNMIVAVSRNSIYSYLYKSGRPLVDALAAELVTDIFAFEETELSRKKQ